MQKASSLVPEIEPSELYKEALKYVESKGGNSVTPNENPEAEEKKEQEKQLQEDISKSRRLMVTTKQQ